MGAKILSIDGGGIKGIIPATILSYIENGVRKNKGNTYYLNQSFDLISGTSTGGILVVGMLSPDDNGNTKYAVSDLLDLYVKKRQHHICYQLLEKAHYAVWRTAQQIQSR